MKTNIASRLTAALLMGIGYGSLVYFDNEKWQGLGRAAYLSHKADLFDRLTSHPRPIVGWMINGCMLALAATVIYEFVVRVCSWFLAPAGGEKA